MEFGSTKLHSVGLRVVCGELDKSLNTGKSVHIQVKKEWYYHF